MVWVQKYFSLASPDYLEKQKCMNMKLEIKDDIFFIGTALFQDSLHKVTNYSDV